MILLKIVNQQSLPDLWPLFYKQYTKHNSNDVFGAYQELLAEIVTRLPYQMKKLIDQTLETGPFFTFNRLAKISISIWCFTTIFIS